MIYQHNPHGFRPQYRSVGQGHTLWAPV
jgi:hypothetical protein